MVFFRFSENQICYIWYKISDNFDKKIKIFRQQIHLLLQMEHDFPKNLIFAKFSNMHLVQLNKIIIRTYCITRRIAPTN